MLFVFFVTDVLGGDEADVGVLRGVQAIGAIAAGAALGVLGARLDVLRLTLVGALPLPSPRSPRSPGTSRSSPTPCRCTPSSSG